MKKFVLSTLMVALTMLSFTSCSKDDDPDNITKLMLTDCLTLCTADESDVPVMLDPIGFNIEFNNTKHTATIVVSEIKFPGGEKFPAITIPNVKFEERGDAIVISAEHIPTTAGSHTPISDEFSLDLYLLNRLDKDNNYSPIFYAEFEFGEYEILSTLNPGEYSGTSVSVSPEGDKFPNDNARFTLDIHKVDDNSSEVVCDIYIIGARFAQAMPELTMVFPNVPVRVDGDDITLRVDALTPQIGERPYPNFPITDLDCRVDLSKGMTMTFNCDVFGKPYSVTARCVNSTKL